ncbi:hypothetical protein C7S13_0893 [Burkholderia cepacia]|nr:hypothetical protein [Burkholderia cepacia]
MRRLDAGPLETAVENVAAHRPRAWTMQYRKPATVADIE